MSTDEDTDIVEQIFPPVTREQVDAAADELQAELLRYAALPMLGNLVAKAATRYIGSGSYEMPFAEYAALVYWREQADAEFTNPVTGAVVEDIFDRIGALFFNIEGYYFTEQRLATDAHDRAELIHRLRLTGLRMRVPAYQVHQEQILRGLFGTYTAQLINGCGFEIEDVIACFSALYRMRTDDFTRFRNDAKSINNQEDVDLHFAMLGEYFSFTADRLAAGAGRALANVERILGAFALRRGEADQHALLPSPFSILRQKPILAIGDGRYFVPNLDLLFPSMQGGIEDLINPDVTASSCPRFLAHVCSTSWQMGRTRVRPYSQPIDAGRLWCNRRLLYIRRRTR